MARCFKCGTNLKISLTHDPKTGREMCVNCDVYDDDD